MNRYALSHMQDRGVRPRHHYIAMLFGVPLVVTLMMGPFSFAEDPALRSEEQVAEHAKAVWESGAINPALEILDQGIQDHPQALTLHKLRGDILTTSRGPQEAHAPPESAFQSGPVDTGGSAHPPRHRSVDDQEVAWGQRGGRAFPRTSTPIPPGATNGGLSALSGLKLNFPAHSSEHPCSSAYEKTSTASWSATLRRVPCGRC